MDPVGKATNPRLKLLQNMEDLAANSKDCSQCSGLCCTFVGNSMQLTFRETRDMYEYLQDSGLWTEPFVAKLKSTIAQYGLDREPAGDGKRNFSRKTYTCPLFKEQSLGCPLPPEVKPFGCLAFNPFQKGVKDGEACRSQIDLLEEIDQKAMDIASPENWNKKPIPVALLYFHELMEAKQ